MRWQPRSFDVLGGGRTGAESSDVLNVCAARPGTVQNALSRRKQAALCAVMGLSAAYAATWSLIPEEGEFPVAASAVTKQLGDYANNFTQLETHPTRPER